MKNAGKSVGLLGLWAAVNGVFVFSGVPALLAAPVQAAGFDLPTSLSQMPFISLTLGVMGAGAVLLISALLSKLHAMRFLKYLGEHSIVVYLAFFLPMAVSRTVLLKFAPFLDIGTVSLLVTIAAVSGPVVLYWLTELTGYGKFLFRRPKWAITDEKSPTSTRARLHPAE